MEPNTKQECGLVSRFEADKAIMHLNFANRRMLIALIIVCVTFIITIFVFVTGYTAREKNWLNTITNMRNTQTTEVANGQPETN